MATSFPLEVIGRVLVDDDIANEWLGCFAGYSSHELLVWIGLGVGLEFRMNWDSRMSMAYFLYLMCMPFGVWVISKPRKYLRRPRLVILKKFLS